MTEKRKVIVDDEEFEVELEKKGTSWQVKIRNREFLIKVEGERKKNSKENKRKKKIKVGNGTVSSSIPGKIISLNVSIGDKVKQGDVLAILEAMKMQNEIVAPIKGVIKQINCDSGDSIIANAPLIIIEGKK
ncbi:MAG: biotin/lipoyl-containing protein [Candidatus Thalassarchaeaceae archaeon]|jgi:biotin carboxyl carrier protein